MVLQPFVRTSNIKFHQNPSSHFWYETFRCTDIIFHTCVQFTPVVQKTHNKESWLESECTFQDSLIKTSLTLRPNIEFMPFTLSLLIRRRCSSYSRNGKPSEISLAFSSPLQSRFGLQTYACRKQPFPVVETPSGSSIVVNKTSGTLPSLYVKRKTNGIFSVSSYYTTGYAQYTQ